MPPGRFFASRANAAEEKTAMRVLEAVAEQIGRIAENSDILRERQDAIDARLDAMCARQDAIDARLEDIGGMLQTLIQRADSNRGGRAEVVAASSSCGSPKNGAIEEDAADPGPTVSSFMALPGKAPEAPIQGLWEDSLRHAFSIDVDKDNAECFNLKDLSRDVDGQVKKSDATLFQGEIDGKGVRFGVRWSRTMRRFVLNTEREEVRNKEITWVSLPTRTYLRNPGPEPETLNEEWTPMEAVVARTLLGTWESVAPRVQSMIQKFVKKQAPRSWTFTLDKEGRLMVYEEDSVPAVLEPVGLMFEGYFGGSFGQVKTRVTMSKSGRLLGELKKKDVWVSDFELSRTEEPEAEDAGMQGDVNVEEQVALKKIGRMGR